MQADGIYIDGTFGRGGHSRAILEKLGENGRLYALDRDPDAISYAHTHFKDEPRFAIGQSSFAGLAALAADWGIVGKVDGLLLDLGVSSPQLDDAQRGFSFLRDGPLDMRMDPSTGESAGDWLARAREEDLVSVFKTYGEERYAKRIAHAICQERATKRFTSTLHFADVVAKAHPAWEKGKHPATRVFQAIRIYINRELDELKAVLQAVPDLLAVGGRLVVISFHSLEDRIVKQFIQAQAKYDQAGYPFDLPIQSAPDQARLKKLSKMIAPSDEECRENPRSRSARMRVAEKLR